MSIARTLLVSILLLGCSALAVGCSHDTSEAARPRTGRAHASTSGSHADRDYPRDDDPTTSRAEEREAAEAAEAELAAPTASDQSEAPDDMEITRSIRAAVVGDGTLSFSAANIVIVTNATVVTLRGNVASDDERDAIVAHARGAAGVSRVDSLLAVDD